MSPRIFVGILGEDTYEFLIYYEDKLCNLGLVESCGVDFVTYQLDTTTRRLWGGFLDSRLAGYSSVTYTHFSKSFVGMYMTHSMCKCLRDEFYALR